MIYDANGFNQNGTHKNGTKYDDRGFDKNRIHKNGTKYDDKGFDKKGIYKNGARYDDRGFDIKGTHKNGTKYNDMGFNLNGIHKNGTYFDDEGFAANGYNVKGINREGFNRGGYDTNGYDKEGYNELGYNKDGIGKDGFNKNGYNKDGYDRNGYNSDGYDIHGFDKNGIDMQGYDRIGNKVRRSDEKNICIEKRNDDIKDLGQRNIKDSNEERYKWLGYVFSVEGLNWLDYKYEINQALKEICGNKFELTNINSKYFFVETLESNELVGINFHNEKVKLDSISLCCKTKFIEKLFKLIPNLNNVKFWANEYTLCNKLKICYIQDDTKSEFDELREEKIIELDKQMIENYRLQNILSSMYGRKYIYIGKVKHTFEIDDDLDKYYEKNEIGDKGAIYASGFDKNLYLVYEIDGDKKTIYEFKNKSYIYNLETEKKYLNENKLYKAKHSISIDSVKYKVYHEDVKYIGGLWWIKQDEYDEYCSDELGYCGHGELYLRNINEVYEGEFLNNKYDGLGKLVKEKDDEYGEAFSYEGSFFRGEFNGIGVLYDKNHKIRYNGNWSHGKKNGTGATYNENGEIIYIGNWNNDKYDGFGTLFNTDGSIKYSGNWYNGRTEEEQNEYYGMY